MISSLYWPYLAADYYSALQMASVVVGVVILLSSLDDLFIDGWYWVRQLWRSLTVWRRHTPLQAAQLREVPEQPIAIMVPAWLEYDVIAPMLESMVGTLEYKNYMIFVGTYATTTRPATKSSACAAATGNWCAWKCRTTVRPARPTA